MPRLKIVVRNIACGLSFVASSRPKTPLRVLCLMAFDTLHMLRESKPLPKPTLRKLATLLDFAACANAAFDGKDYSRRECRETLRLLEEAGIRAFVVEYLQRLWDLESSRPLPGGDDWRFRKVGSYREAVARLSLGMVAAAANDSLCLEEGIRATYCDPHLEILFRIVMQCQIIDDVLDYAQDTSARLPSFLTAAESLPRAFELTRLAALGYGDQRDLPRTGDSFPLRQALYLVATCTKLVIALGRWRSRLVYRPFADKRPEMICSPLARA
ncbi:MAG TPA: hypothetical protein VHC22_17655 [Pirellulales bacterium]|nr:hypothetical protein [Pirellulales bacterium]